MKESVKVLIRLVHSFKALSVLHSHSQHLLHLVVAAIGGQVYPVEAATDSCVYYAVKDII